MSARPIHVWFDAETTVRCPNFDRMVEAGVIITDSDLVELARYSSLVEPGALGRERLAGCPEALAMHTESGLLDALNSEALPALRDVEREIVALVDAFTDQPAVLSGSGVAAFDLQFIRQQTPQLTSRLEYWTHDIGHLRREWKRATGTELVTANQHKPHRALIDIDLHLIEARAFREVLTEAGAVVGSTAALTLAT